MHRDSHTGGTLFFSVLVRNGFILFTCARGPNQVSTAAWHALEYLNPKPERSLKGTLGLDSPE